LQGFRFEPCRSHEPQKEAPRRALIWNRWPAKWGQKAAGKRMARAQRAEALS